MLAAATRIAGRQAARVLAAHEITELLEHDPTLSCSTRRRNRYVDPLGYVQVDALQRWHEGDRQDSDLERLLIQTVRGIARGLRNAG